MELEERITIEEKSVDPTERDDSGVIGGGGAVVKSKLSVVSLRKRASVITVDAVGDRLSFAAGDRETSCVIDGQGETTLLPVAAIDRPRTASVRIVSDPVEAVVVTQGPMVVVTEAELEDSSAIIDDDDEDDDGEEARNLDGRSSVHSWSRGILTSNGVDGSGRMPP
jgi:hypothetical protein